MANDIFANIAASGIGGRRELLCNPEPMEINIDKCFLDNKDLTPFKLQITASELSTVAAIIVLYTVLTSGEYSVIAGAENPSL